MTEDASGLGELAVDVARGAGKMVLAELGLGLYRRGPIEQKSARELVSQVDRASERWIVEAIRERYPDHAILAEEGGAHVGLAGAAEYRWIVDPLDGTTNFLHGHPIFAVSVAVERLPPQSAPPARGGPELVAAAIYVPYLDETYFAVRDEGAFLNSRTLRLAVSPTGVLEDALVATGFAYERDRYPNYDNFVRVAERTRGIRRCGAAAVDLAFVAAGRYDAFWELGLRAHDVAAGALLVREAGGRVADLVGGQDWLEGGSIVASNGHLHAPLTALLALPFGAAAGASS